jgi:tRNA pseudouridine38-40 synthase
MICRFHTFFTHLDNYRDNTFLYLTAGGIEATKMELPKKNGENGAKQEYEEDSEDENPEGGEG